jgi:uncharacterized tellurite resistance protein B-like protein
MKITPPAEFQESSTRELLAMLELMYLVATADGFFSAEERREFMASMQSLSEGKIGSAELTRLVDQWISEGPETDLDGRLKTLAESLPDELSRRVAYGMALQIAEADGQYLQSEAALLARAARAFGLEEEESEDIANSVRMSRRPRP